MRPFVIPVSFSVIPVKTGIHLFFHRFCTQTSTMSLVVSILILSLACLVPSSFAVEKQKDDSTAVAKKQEKIRQKIEKARTMTKKAKAESTGRSDVYTPVSSSQNDSVVVEQPAELISQKETEYPRLAKQAGLTGKVWVKALVGQDGKVIQAIVGKSSGVQSLDEAAIDSALKTEFKPALQRGRPINCWVTYPIEFKLDK